MVLLIKLLLGFCFLAVSTSLFALNTENIARAWTIYDDSGNISKRLGIDAITSNTFSGSILRTDYFITISGDIGLSDNSNTINFTFEGKSYFGWISDGGNYISGYYEKELEKKPWYARASNAPLIGTISQNLDISIPSISFTPPLKVGDIFSFAENYWGNFEYSHEENGTMYWKLKDFGINLTGFYK